MRILPYGERGTYIAVENESVRSVVSALREAFPAADVVAGASSVAVFGTTMADVEPALDAGLPVQSLTLVGRMHEIDCVYDGPDLAEVAAKLQISTDELIALHNDREYDVQMVGFLPGFAYLGPLDQRLVLPRRTAPRVRVPAGSVAIAGEFTGIYPQSSPGGWSLLGTSGQPKPFEPTREPPVLFSLGDKVRFKRVAELPPQRR